MFGIGTTELLIIMLVALIVLGPKQLPGIARSLGKALGEFRRVTTDVQRTLNLEAAKIEEDEREQKKAATAVKKAEEPQAKSEPFSTPPSAAGEESIPPSKHADSNPYVAARGETSPEKTSPDETSPDETSPDKTPADKTPADERQPQPMTSHASSQESTASTQTPSASSVARETSPAGESEKEASDSSESSHSKAQA
ncbi:Sec-independent protein translocase protein TatB [Desulfonatronum lacustre]|uniref:Sec-independent protein translocase protein TatB n=1 Tax=Desulfonatronum lacustre TaxID=66849 RepID=UPI0004BCE2A2|nr:Sec-independent protein translocase protein TatB [Desulfonatronum lacustre]